MAYDRGSLGRASLSSGVVQQCVCRQCKPSRSSMRRIWLAAFEPDAGVFGRLDQRIQTPLRGYLFVTSHHRPVPLFTNRPGGGWRTSAMSLLTSSTVKRRGRSPSPKVPSASKRCSRRRTVCALHCNSLAMASTPSPSQLRTTIRVCRIKSAGYAGSLPVCAPSVLPSHPGRSHSQDLQHFRALPFSMVSLLILSPFEELSSR